MSSELVSLEEFEIAKESRNSNSARNSDTLGSNLYFGVPITFIELTRKRMPDSSSKSLIRFIMLLERLMNTNSVSLNWTFNTQ
jgi:hypothetical protein